jgi:hypothetical protein
MSDIIQCFEWARTSDDVREWWCQYAGAAAGYAPGIARRLRRIAETEARARGWAAPARLIQHARSWREWGAPLTGAPGLLGGAESAAAYAARRRAAYGPGRLP